ncbi:hypothetical protein ISCGN_002821 [Ixodes scapularis]
MSEEHTSVPVRPEWKEKSPPKQHIVGQSSASGWLWSLAKWPDSGQRLAERGRRRRRYLHFKENISYPEACRRFGLLRKGSFAQVVQWGPAPLTVAAATRTSFLDYGRPLQSPTLQLKIQLPGRAISAERSTDPPTQGANRRTPTGQQPLSSQAVSQTQDGPVATATTPPPQSSSREKGRHSRPNSLEEHHQRSGMAPVPLLERLRDRNGWTWVTPRPAPSLPLWLVVGRAWRPVPQTRTNPEEKPRLRKLRPWLSVEKSPLMRLTRTTWSGRLLGVQETEAMDECRGVSTHVSDQDDIEWQTSKMESLGAEKENTDPEEGASSSDLGPLSSMGSSCVADGRPWRVACREGSPGLFGPEVRGGRPRPGGAFPCSEVDASEPASTLGLGPGATGTAPVHPPTPGYAWYAQIRVIVSRFTTKKKKRSASIEERQAVILRKDWTSASLRGSAPAAGHAPAPLGHSTLPPRLPPVPFPHGRLLRKNKKAEKSREVKRSSKAAEPRFRRRPEERRSLGMVPRRPLKGPGDDPGKARRPQTNRKGDIDIDSTLAWDSRQRPEQPQGWR